MKLTSDNQMQRGMVLIITVIMLAVITLMAIAYIGFARRERVSVAMSLIHTETQLGLDIALDRARRSLEDQLRRFEVPGVRVSTGLSNQPPTGGFDTSEISFYHTDQLGNLRDRELPPVTYDHNKDGTADEFRFWLDLNRDGNFQHTGRYHFIPGRLSWSQAKTKAEILGGHLATLQPNEVTKLPDSIKSLLSNRLAWIGGYQVSGQGEPLGGWRWITGGTLDDVNSLWALNQPDNNGNANALCLAFTGGRWSFRDEPVNQQNVAGFLMEYETHQAGDPQWEGQLQLPHTNHMKNNQFIARHAYMALPAGLTIDLNKIHNRNKYAGTPADYLRGQVVSPYPVPQLSGSGVLNLAGTLNALNPTLWNYNYDPRMSGPSSGTAFWDAQSLWNFRGLLRTNKWGPLLWPTNNYSVDWRHENLLDLYRQQNNSIYTNFAWRLSHAKERSFYQLAGSVGMVPRTVPVGKINLNEVRQAINSSDPALGGYIPNKISLINITNDVITLQIPHGLYNGAQVRFRVADTINGHYRPWISNSTPGFLPDRPYFTPAGTMIPMSTAPCSLPERSYFAEVVDAHRLRLYTRRSDPDEPEPHLSKLPTRYQVDFMHHAIHRLTGNRASGMPTGFNSYFIDRDPMLNTFEQLADRFLRDSGRDKGLYGISRLKVFGTAEAYPWDYGAETHRLLQVAANITDRYTHDTAGPAYGAGYPSLFHPTWEKYKDGNGDEFLTINGFVREPNAGFLSEPDFTLPKASPSAASVPAIGPDGWAHDSRNKGIWHASREYSATDVIFHASKWFMCKTRLAGQWNSTSRYSAGNRVGHMGYIYRCISSVTVPSAGRMNPPPPSDRLRWVLHVHDVPLVDPVHWTPLQVINSPDRPDRMLWREVDCPAWKERTAYTLGQYVSRVDPSTGFTWIHKCISPHTSSLSFDPNFWSSGRDFEHGGFPMVIGVKNPVSRDATGGSPRRRIFPNLNEVAMELFIKETPIPRSTQVARSLRGRVTWEISNPTLMHTNVVGNISGQAMVFEVGSDNRRTLLGRIPFNHSIDDNSGNEFIVSMDRALRGVSTANVPIDTPIKLDVEMRFEMKLAAVERNSAGLIIARRAVDHASLVLRPRDPVSVDFINRLPPGQGNRGNWVPGARYNIGNRVRFNKVWWVSHKEFTSPGAFNYLNCWAPLNEKRVEINWQVNDPLVNDLDGHYSASNPVQEYVQPWKPNFTYSYNQMVSMTGPSGLKEYWRCRVRSSSRATFNVFDWVRAWQGDNIAKRNERSQPWSPTDYGDPQNIAHKDPGIHHPYNWEFPNQEQTSRDIPMNTGHLGRIHRGTPWQTLYLKSLDYTGRANIVGKRDIPNGPAPARGLPTPTAPIYQTLHPHKFRTGDIVTLTSSPGFDFGGPIRYYVRIFNSSREFSLHSTSFSALQPFPLHSPQDIDLGPLTSGGWLVLENVNAWTRWAGYPETKATNDWRLLDHFSSLVPPNNRADWRPRTRYLIGDIVRYQNTWWVSNKNLPPVLMERWFNEYRIWSPFRGTTGQSLLSVNQAHHAAWAAAMSGAPVNTRHGNQYISSNDGKMRMIVDAISDHRTRQHGDQPYERISDILAVPELTDKSPYLNGLNPTDRDLEAIPEQILPLLRSSRYEDPYAVLYGFAQSLRPADKSIDSRSGLVANYNVIGEQAGRAVAWIANRPREKWQPNKWYRPGDVVWTFPTNVFRCAYNSDLRPHLSDANTNPNNIALPHLDNAPCWEEVPRYEPENQVPRDPRFGPENPRYRWENAPILPYFQGKYVTRPQLRQVFTCLRKHQYHQIAPERAPWLWQEVYTGPIKYSPFSPFKISSFREIINPDLSSTRVYNTTPAHPFEDGDLVSLRGSTINVPWPTSGLVVRMGHGTQEFSLQFRRSGEQVPGPLRRGWLLVPEENPGRPIRYVKGDHVRIDNRVFRCIKPHTVDMSNAAHDPLNAVGKPWVRVPVRLQIESFKQLNLRQPK